MGHTSVAHTLTLYRLPQGASPGCWCILYYSYVTQHRHKWLWNQIPAPHNLPCATGTLPHGGVREIVHPGYVNGPDPGQVSFPELIVPPATAQHTPGQLSPASPFPAVNPE